MCITLYMNFVESETQFVRPYRILSEIKYCRNFISTSLSTKNY
jgi:hypothetical protein